MGDKTTGHYLNRLPCVPVGPLISICFSLISLPIEYLLSFVLLSGSIEQLQDDYGNLWWARGSVPLLPTSVQSWGAILHMCKKILLVILCGSKGSLIDCLIIRRFSHHGLLLKTTSLHSHSSSVLEAKEAWSYIRIITRESPRETRYLWFCIFYFIF